jgi:hypothetical protein
MLNLASDIVKTLRKVLLKERRKKRKKEGGTGKQNEFL